MKNHSFYQFILKEINKNAMNRLNLPSFTRVIRKKAQDVPTTQLMYLYRELQRLKSKNSLLHSNNNSDSYTKHLKHSQKNSMMNFESYEKHTLICLEEIAMKLKEKNGFQEGVDLCKLFYFRLLNVIQYNLPYVNVLQQFREEFLWKDVGQDVIDYVALIEKDPKSYGSEFIQTVNLIIQTVQEELQNIDILQLPYLKYVLSKGKEFKIYDIDNQLLQKLDSIINQNKFSYTFRELESCLISDNKNKEIQQYYALLSKDSMEKRLNYLYIDSMTNQLGDCTENQQKDVRKQVGIPGRTVCKETIYFFLRKMSEFSLYGVYIDIFQGLGKKQLGKTQILKQYIKYHSNYFSKSGNTKCNINKIIDKLVNELQYKRQINDKGIKFDNLQIFRLFFVIDMLSRQQINAQSLIESHNCLDQQLSVLNTIQKPKFQHISKIFDGSMKYFKSKDNLQNLKPLMISFSEFIQQTEEITLMRLLNQELQILATSQKMFLMNEMIIYLTNNLGGDKLTQFTQSVSKLLELFMKSQFKKFSTESSNIQKILLLTKESQFQAKVLNQSKKDQP